MRVVFFITPFFCAFAACNRYPKESKIPHLVVTLETQNGGRVILQGGDRIQIVSSMIGSQSISQLSHSWVKESEDDYIVSGTATPLTDIVRFKNSGFVNDTAFFALPANSIPGPFVVKSMVIDNNGMASRQITSRPLANFVVNEDFPLIQRLAPDSLNNSLRVNDSVRIRMLSTKINSRSYTEAKCELVYKNNVIETFDFAIASEKDSLMMNVKRKFPDIPSLTLGDKILYRFMVTNDLGNKVERRVNYIITQ